MFDDRNEEENYAGHRDASRCAGDLNLGRYTWESLETELMAAFAVMMVDLLMWSADCKPREGVRPPNAEVAF